MDIELELDRRLMLIIAATATSRIPFTEAGLPDQVKRCLDDSEASLELMRQAARATANLVIDEGQWPAGTTRSFAADQLS